MKEYDSDIKEIKTTLKEHDKRFDKIETTLKEHDKHFIKIDKRFEQIETTLKEHGKRIDDVWDEVHKQGVLSEERDSKIDLILEYVISLTDKKPSHEEMATQLESHGMRLDAVEYVLKEAHVK